jgi:cell division protein FtsI/penicillin-binding protein 2
VVKLFTAAMLLDKGYITPDTIIDCEGGYAVVDGRRLHDSPGHYLGVATFREALRFSSNIGLVKAAQVLENNEWHAMLRAFGFGAPTGIDLPGEGFGILYPVSKWTKFSRTSLPMGYEISLTPIQIAAAISTTVNGGVFYQPYVVEEIRDPKGNVLQAHNPEPVRRVLRPTTSAIMRDLMEDVAELGTGKKAQLEGYRVGGKTGTTRKSNVFTHREYIASFGGALPINDPRVVLYVYVDNPKGEYYASIVAAPVFHEIASACVLHLGIAPSQELIAQQPASPEQVAMLAVEEHEKANRNAELAFFGRMPDFQGLTMKEARGTLPRNLSRIKFLGTGLVSDQYPAPGEPLNEQTEVVLHFAPALNPMPAPTGRGQNGGNK